MTMDYVEKHLIGWNHNRTDRYQTVHIKDNSAEYSVVVKLP